MKNGMEKPKKKVVRFYYETSIVAKYSAQWIHLKKPWNGGIVWNAEYLAHGYHNVVQGTWFSTASAPFKFEYLQNGRIKTSTEERKWEKELLKKKIGSWITEYITLLLLSTLLLLLYDFQIHLHSLCSGNFFIFFLCRRLAFISLICESRLYAKSMEKRVFGLYSDNVIMIQI